MKYELSHHGWALYFLSHGFWSVAWTGTTWFVRQRIMSGGLDRPLVIRIFGQNLAFVMDRQGTTLAAVRPDGLRDGNVAYFGRNAFGRLEGASGSGSSTNTETGFTGASTPNQTGGFTYLRNRWYDPQSGRFLTQDPIGLAGGVNLYAYAGNNPVTFSDPFGLAPCCKWLRQAASVVAGFVPGVSEASDLTTAVSGRDVISGDRVGTGGRIAAAAGVVLPIVSGGLIRGAGKFLSAAEEKLAKEFGNTFSVKVRPSLGGDGASSAHLLEVDAAGETVSKTHRVVSPEGDILHQHQTHVGQHGSEHDFPDEWVQFPDVK